MQLPRQPIRELTCGGTPFEMGTAQGETFREDIHRSLETVETLEAVRLMKPRIVPHRLFLRFAEHRADRFLKGVFSAVPNSSDERLRGIARGARVPLRRLALCCALEAVLSDLTPVTAPAVNAGCSALAVTRGASETGAPILAHNFDYLPLVQPYYFIRRSHPRDGLRSVELAVKPLAGAIDGVNETGLAITCNYAYAVDRGPQGPTITMHIAEALSRFACVDETVAYFRTAPRVGGGLLMLGDATGRIAALDVSNSRVELREAEHDRMFHTNRYCCPAMREVELSPAAVHNERSPLALRGRRVHQSAELRDARLRQLLHGRDAFDVDAVQRVMGDHGASGSPSADTICMHGDYWHTTASLQLLPSRRALRASFSPACVAEYEEFQP